MLTANKATIDQSQKDFLSPILNPAIDLSHFLVGTFGESGFPAAFLPEGETLSLYNFDPDRSLFDTQRADLPKALDAVNQLYAADRAALAASPVDLLSEASLLAAPRRGFLRRQRDYYRRYRSSLKSSFKELLDANWRRDAQKMTKVAYFGAHFEALREWTRPINMYLDGKFQGRNYASPVLSYRWMRLVKNLAVEQNLQSVFEFGSGAGRNLVALKKLLGQNTPLNLCGIDYSLSRTVNAMMALHLFGVKDDRTWAWTANGLALPFKTGAFDLSFSCHVIEQMKGYEEKAIDEILRVSRKYAIFLEPSAHMASLQDRYWIFAHHRSFRYHEILSQRKDVEIIRCEKAKDDGGPCSTPTLLTIVRKR